MKYVILLLLILTITACSQSNYTPKEEDFEVTVKVVDKELKTNTDIELVLELTNLSKKSITILHAAPLIHFQIYNEQNKPLVDSFFTDTIGINHKLKPNEPYNNDSEIFNSGKRTFKIEKSGKYKITGTASFSVHLRNGERQDYKITSNPLEVIVE